MKTRMITLALLFSGVAGFAGARALYRIDLRGNTSILTRDEPVAHGSVLLFHRHPDGRLTGVPSESVAGVTAVGKSTITRTTSTTVVKAPRLARTVGTAAPAPVHPLAPGEAIAIGPTGGDGAAAAAPARNMAQPSGAPSPSGDIRARAAVDAQVFPGDLPAQTGNGTATGGTAYGTTNGTTAINPTLTTPANTGTTGTAAATAAGASTPGAAQPIGPNGYPTTSGPGPQPGAAQPVGPNGFPTTGATTTGTATSGTATTGSGTANNGTATTQSGATTTNQGTANQGTQNNSNGTATTAPANPNSNPPANNGSGSKPNGSSPGKPN